MYSLVSLVQFHPAQLLGREMRGVDDLRWRIFF
jgi:hypothetical protein